MACPRTPPARDFHPTDLPGLTSWWAARGGVMVDMLKESTGVPSALQPAVPAGCDGVDEVVEFAPLDGCDPPHVVPAG